MFPVRNFQGEGFKAVLQGELRPGGVAGEGFPRHFDLVTAIEVAEHLYEEDGDLFFDHLCS